MKHWETRSEETGSEALEERAGRHAVKRWKEGLQDTQWSAGRKAVKTRSEGLEERAGRHAVKRWETRSEVLEDTQ